MHGAVRAVVGMGKGMIMEFWVQRLEVALSSTPPDSADIQKYLPRHCSFINALHSWPVKRVTVSPKYLKNCYVVLINSTSFDFLITILIFIYIYP